LPRLPRCLLLRRRCVRRRFRPGLRFVPVDRPQINPRVSAVARELVRRLMYSQVSSPKGVIVEGVPSKSRTSSFC
jgi:hypothetical protein